MVQKGRSHPEVGAGMVGVAGRTRSLVARTRVLPQKGVRVMDLVGEEATVPHPTYRRARGRGIKDPVFVC